VERIAKWGLERAITTDKLNNGHQIDWCGVTYTSTKKLAASAGVSAGQLSKRLARGEPAADAIAAMHAWSTRPPRTPKPKHVREPKRCEQCGALGVTNRFCVGCASKAHEFVYKGVRYSSSRALCLTLGLRAQAINWRRSRYGESLDHAVAECLARTHSVVVDGVRFRSGAECTRVLGLSNGSFRDRVKAGMTAQEAADSLRWSDGIELGGREHRSVGDVAVAIGASARETWAILLESGADGIRRAFDARRRQGTTAA
jgi:hypothetical protein